MIADMRRGNRRTVRHVSGAAVATHGPERNNALSRNRAGCHCWLVQQCRCLCGETLLGKPAVAPNFPTHAVINKLTIQNRG
jgi:hypothetical protein